MLFSRVSFPIPGQQQNLSFRKIYFNEACRFLILIIGGETNVEQWDENKIVKRINPKPFSSEEGFMRILLSSKFPANYFGSSYLRRSDTLNCYPHRITSAPPSSRHVHEKIRSSIPSLIRERCPKTGAYARTRDQSVIISLLNAGNSSDVFHSEALCVNVAIKTPRLGPSRNDFCVRKSGESQSTR